MKKLLYLLPLLFFMASCDKGLNPSDSVGLQAAFAHCSHSVGYWVWGILISLACLTVIGMMYRANEWKGLWLALIAVLLLLAWGLRPAGIAWSTTVEQAARGIWIGY